MKLICRVMVLMALSASATAQSCCAVGSSCATDVFLTSDRPLAGVRYTVRRFDLDQSALVTSENKSFFNPNQLETVELFGRYAIRGRHFFTLTIPYVILIDRPRKTAATGMGDPVLFYQYQLPWIKSKCNGWQQHLRLGFGLKFPIGKYNTANDQGLQLGTGSVDILTAANYMGQMGHWGVLLGINYKANTQNNAEVKLGDKLQVLGDATFEWRRPSWRLLLTAGFGYEEIFMTRSHYKWKDYTGSKNVFADASLEFHARHFAMSIKAQPSVYARVNGTSFPKPLFNLESGWYYIF